MFKFLIIILIFVSVNIGICQNNYQDVVYLKNGSIIRGMIIEQIPNKSLKIETADKNIFVFTFEEIEKITKEKSAVNETEELDLTENQEGYLRIFETSYGIGVGELSENSYADKLRASIINSYKFNPYFSAGIGLGITYYSKLDRFTLPIFFDFRVNLFQNKPLTPYLFLDFGYVLKEQNGFAGSGLLINPGIGVSIKLNKYNNINLGLNYDSQSANIGRAIYNIQSGNYLDYTNNENSVKSINLNLGITF